ncbi:hypothetical protein B0H13DRAFT_2269393 [Mycena leptocephala]|nr:hypothetical protein B0H13DRAFT_2269393 [Mycena leptocephala]
MRAIKRDESKGLTKISLPLVVNEPVFTQVDFTLPLPGRLPSKAPCSVRENTVPCWARIFALLGALIKMRGSRRAGLDAHLVREPSAHRNPGNCITWAAKRTSKEWTKQTEHKIFIPSVNTEAGREATLRKSVADPGLFLQSVVFDEQTLQRVSRLTVTRAHQIPFGFEQHQLGRSPSINSIPIPRSHTYQPRDESLPPSTQSHSNSGHDLPPLGDTKSDRKADHSGIFLYTEKTTFAASSTHGCARFRAWVVCGEMTILRVGWEQRRPISIKNLERGRWTKAQITALREDERKGGGRG